MTIRKKNYDYSTDVVTVQGKGYNPDYIINFPIEKDEINLENCTCVFSIRNRNNLAVRQYVGAEFFENLNNENIQKEINGYLPEAVFCFTASFFPLEEFLKEKDFKPFFRF
ncbi:hypothetical protein [Flavobacterium sp. ABG]|uniref:hypothetical protein n=1 Tax=Flavobacterium sp. ABG TaxID=1423322 RepID=UPI0006497793|nr:hypothetical protein [Flavobacterium sp. ABG]KLT69911.1 hypothetical protein AB674_09410 [Flavobacterium sp. ABG]